MEKKHTIIIVDSRLEAHARSILSFLSVVLGPISLGILLNSIAMQWVGFVLGSLFFITLAMKRVRDQTSHTIEGARKVLDALEAESEAP